ncbi:hypothetical protein R1sor_025893 [Riccia sorocarpa]|uniref:Uncharacterized protein n=1 Tax=Riccia sorocarpa TaxID=122646 RepID=A0ABD3G9Y1_9MARC
MSDSRRWWVMYMCRSKEWFQKQNTTYRPCLPPEMDLAISLHCLGHGSTYFDLREQFGCRESTTHEVVDYQGSILDIFVGMQGIANDQRVLRNSGFYRKEILNSLELPLLTGFQLKPYIMRYAGYTTLPWLMSPCQISEEYQQQVADIPNESTSETVAAYADTVREELASHLCQRR